MSEINEKPYSKLYFDKYISTKDHKEMYHFLADVLSHYSFNYVRSRVEKNPTKMTFNPAEAELQKLYHKWHDRWKHKQFEYVLLFAGGVALILLFLLLFHDLGIITLPEQLLQGEKYE